MQSSNEITITKKPTLSFIHVEFPPVVQPTVSKHWRQMHTPCLKEQTTFIFTITSANW